jgi:hypothetical protein
MIICYTQLLVGATAKESLPNDAVVKEYCFPDINLLREIEKK